MFASITKGHLPRQCACIARSSRAARAFAPVAAKSSPPLDRQFASTSTARSSDLPWFVDPASAPSAPDVIADRAAPLATAPVPTAPPSHLAVSLHPLHAHLSVSPFFDKESLTYIHAREADPMESWCDWIVLCTLKQGRERGLRGAVESVRTYLASNPVEFDSTEHETAASSSPSPFSPPATHPLIHGLPPTTASKHARSRARKGPPPTRQDQASGWALLDAGTLVVHVMTSEARVEYGDEIERVWNGVAKEEGVVTKREQLAQELRERELQDNLEEAARELELEEETSQNRTRTTVPQFLPWTVPSPLAPLYAYFPLYTVSNQDANTPAPTTPTLWVLGPPPPGHRESLDPICRQAQSFARFSHLQVESRYLQDGLGAPGASLPTLHTPSGDLIETENVHRGLVAQQVESSARPTSPEDTEKDDDQKDPVLQAYAALVETTLLPAVVAALYLSPEAPPVIPRRSFPFLSQIARNWLGISERQHKIAEVKRLRGGKISSKSVLDLEEVEREAVEALEALENKVNEVKGSPWFFGSSSPTQFDAILYSLLSIIAVLPAQGDHKLLRTTLERSPSLTKWYKAHEP
ncbi:uncharacterized protein JCM15063_003069 [Sporobolomyces koalae]|uniref:uncharacterized protein n=1 Tax=Sporobolomyces koalae TaxID=500713 RepID=UPI00316FFD17